MNRDFILRHWYASVYDQFEENPHDIPFLLLVLKEQTDGTPQNILEVACGGGRMSVPLAEAGHRVTGFDADPFMLLHGYRKAKHLPNLRMFEMNILDPDWGTGYDVVIASGNVLINLEYLPGAVTYRQAQRTLIQSAAKALRPGGHLYLDFSLHANPVAVFHGSKTEPMHYFEGTDDLGTTGRTCGYGGIYNPVTRQVVGSNHAELTTNSGEALVFENPWGKYIPTQAQVYGWLQEAGLILEQAYRNYTDEPLPEPVPEKTWHATLWARKA